MQLLWQSERGDQMSKDVKKDINEATVGAIIRMRDTLESTDEFTYEQKRVIDKILTGLIEDTFNDLAKSISDYIDFRLG